MVQAVARAVGLLERLDAAGSDGAGLAELARQVDLKAPTARNLLQTLEALGYVRQDALTRRYRLGDRAAALGRRSVAERLAKVAEPHLEALSQAVGETVLLTLYEAGERRTIASSESDQLLRVAAQLGSDDRFHTTATGRMLLALLDEPERAELSERLGPPGESWPAADEEGMGRELEGLRRTGCARFERPGVHAFAVPVRLPGVTAALGLYLPSVRFTPVREPELVGALRATAARLAEEYERTSS